MHADIQENNLTHTK